MGECGCVWGAGVGGVWVTGGVGGKWVSADEEVMLVIADVG